MKKQYTKKQITEAIAYWKKQLKKLNESNEARYRTDKVLSRKEEISTMLYDIRNFCSSVKEAYSLEKDIDEAGYDLEFMMRELGGSINWRNGAVQVSIPIYG